MKIIKSIWDKMEKDYLRKAVNYERKIISKKNASMIQKNPK